MKKIKYWINERESVELPAIDDKKDVFISYKRENVDFVARLARELNNEEHNISAWFDIEKLHKNVGEDYKKRIQEAIRSSSLFLLIYTKEVENSEFIINEELCYALENDIKILFYPQDSIDLKTSKIAKYIEKLQWLDTMKTATLQSDTLEALHDEGRKSQLAALTKSSHGFSIYDDQNIILIRIALQRELKRFTPFGNYKKLCGTLPNEPFNNGNLRLRVINKKLKMEVPKEYYEKLENKHFFKKETKDQNKEEDSIPEVDRHTNERNCDEEELMASLKNFIETYQCFYSIKSLYKWIQEHLVGSEYSSIAIPPFAEMNLDMFFILVRKKVACDFIKELEDKKTMFNGAMLGVYDITDTRTVNVEEPYVDVLLYYSDYFTFKCMTEMYHILCSINDAPFSIETIADIKPLAPFLCSLGLGGFIVPYHKGRPYLMWTKRSEKISSGDMWHFSYDETVSLLKDSSKDKDDHIIVSNDGTVHLDIEQILYRAIVEEVGAKRQKIQEENHGVFEIGIIKSERLEIEILSYSALHLKNEPSMYEQMKNMHDVASDGYLEISKIHFTPFNDLHTLVTNFLTPESFSIAKRIGESLLPNVGKGVNIGKNVMIEDDCILGNNVSIGDGCKIHHNVYIDNNVTIGKKCKIQNNNSIYEGVTLEDGVFIGTNVSFTNDLYPRAIRRVDGELVQRGDWKMKETKVCYGASIGAGAVIRCGITIGEWAMVGCGAVVLDDVPAGATVVGNPARVIAIQDKY